MKIYIGILSLFWVVGGIFLAIHGYEQSFLILNRLHISAGDMIFPYITFLCDPIWFLGVVGLIWGRKHPDWFLAIIGGIILNSLIINGLKTNLFDDWFRPPIVFGKEHIHYITLQGEVNNTFPSGHASAAAFMGFCLATLLHERQYVWGILNAFIAIFLSYSRVYIGVHFLGDILAGSMIGFASTALMYFLLKKRLHTAFQSLSITSNQKIAYVVMVLSVLAIIADVYHYVVLFSQS